MRLTCPNCDAKYEVPDEVIPVTGRDVQCSNCGQTWFQHHADYVPELDDEFDEDDVSLEDMGPEPDEEIAPPPPPPTPAPPPPPPPAPEPRRRELDPAVADILREEAEAEQAARRAQRPAEPLETQPDLGLEETDSEDEADRRSREARERMARMRGEEPPDMAEAAATAAAIGSRRDLLPDIEEINSTLRSSSDRAPGMSHDEATYEAPSYRREKRGFRRGFTIVMLLFLALIALYIFAPQLARAVPAMDPWLNSYVAKVDQWRMMLNEQLQGLLLWLDDAASRSQAG